MQPIGYNQSTTPVKQVGFAANSAFVQFEKAHHANSSAVRSQLSSLNNDANQFLQFNATGHDDLMIDKMANQGTDIYRDTPVRYTGYSNEVGLAVKTAGRLGSMMLLPSFFISGGYAIMDAISKYRSTQKAAKQVGNISQKEIQFDAKASGIEALLFHGLATIGIPSIVLLGVEKIAHKLLHNTKNQASFFIKHGPTFAKLLTIPLIVKPIDHFTEKLLAKFYEPKVEAKREELHQNV